MQCWAGLQAPSSPRRDGFGLWKNYAQGEWKKGCFAGGAELFQTGNANTIANEWSSLLPSPKAGLCW